MPSSQSVRQCSHCGSPLPKGTQRCANLTCFHELPRVRVQGNSQPRRRVLGELDINILSNIHRERPLPLQRPRYSVDVSPIIPKEPPSKRPRYGVNISPIPPPENNHVNEVQSRLGPRRLSDIIFRAPPPLTQSTTWFKRHNDKKIISETVLTKEYPLLQPASNNLSSSLKYPILRPAPPNTGFITRTHSTQTSHGSSTSSLSQQSGGPQTPIQLLSFPLSSPDPLQGPALRPRPRPLQTLPQSSPDPLQGSAHHLRPLLPRFEQLEIDGLDNNIIEPSE